MTTKVILSLKSNGNSIKTSKVLKAFEVLNVDMGRCLHIFTLQSVSVGW
jgi:hypothetical protein